MASIKILKDNINFVAAEIIEEGFHHLISNPKADKAGINQLIDDTADLHNDLLNKINDNDARKAAKSSKAYFATLKTEMNDKLNALVDRLNKLIA